MANVFIAVMEPQRSMDHTAGVSGVCASLEQTVQFLQAMFAPYTHPTDDTFAFFRIEEWTVEAPNGNRVSEWEYYRKSDKTWVLERVERG